MYTWTQYEDLTAAKLNKMQERPLMDSINRAGVSGGLDGSSLSMETIGCDLGSAGTPPDPIHTQEHDLGYWRMAYDTETEQWRLKSGSAGVTGVVVKDAGSETWLLTCTSCEAGNWHHITTDKWGNVITSQQVVDSCSHATRMWNPTDNGSGGGDIWRRMGTVYKDERFANVNPSERNQWIYTAKNENNALMMPVARHVGWCRQADINICTAQDVRDRKDNSVWVRTAMPDKGATVPIRAVGELGGTFVYRTTDGGSNEVGIGIASGIEIYDSNTIGNYNTCSTRPQSTTARVDFGSCGKFGFLQLENINPKHPWQWMLTGALDLGSMGSIVDIGTQQWAEIVNCGKLPFANTQWSDGRTSMWSGYAATSEDRRWSPVRPQAGIIASTQVDRLFPQGAWTGSWGERVYGHRAGDVIDGKIGIGTALQIFPNWSYDQRYDRIDNCQIAWNPNGGLITGIEFGAEGWPMIDTEGHIKLPNKKYMGNWFVARATYNPECKNPFAQQTGVICAIDNLLHWPNHWICDGKILLTGAHFNQSSTANYAGVISSVTMTCSTCQPRICDGKMFIPKGGEAQEICMANYYPQICTVPGLIQSAVWHDDITYIDHGDIKLGTAHWSQELGDHLCDRTGGIREICVVGAKSACIQNGKILIDLGTQGGGGGCVPTANYNPLYPQFKRTGTVNQIEWADCTTQIAQGDIKLSTAYFDPGTAGASWTQVQRTGGITGLCWGTKDGKAMIDNGWIYAPTAVYYPCNSGPVPNRPGLIRGVKAVDYLLPAPFIDECGYLHIRA